MQLTLPQMLLQLTYYEFAKEELETLDNGAATTGSSITTSSSDELEAGQQLDRHSAEPITAQGHAMQRDSAGFETVQLCWLPCIACLTSLVAAGLHPQSDVLPLLIPVWLVGSGGTTRTYL